MLRDLVKRVLPAPVRAKGREALTRAILGRDPGSPTYSTGGEDALLNYLFGFRNQGFFVDVGAFHPIHSSNTYLFYLKGWRGINIDARPGSMDAFDRVRPRDINLVRAISSGHETLTYAAMGDHPSMNSFSDEFMGALQTRDLVTSRTPIETVPLAHVLAEHLPVGQEIDFMTIDVEGMELQVLSSNDWTLHRPSLVLLESFAPLGEELFAGEVASYMAGQRYRMILKTTTEMGFLAEEVRLSRVGQIEVRE
jgi:FkbM family methyltransferase